MYAIEAKDLRDYFTTKDDYKKGYVKRPCDEDLVYAEEFKGLSEYDDQFESESLT
mgnify:FL=1